MKGPILPGEDLTTVRSIPTLTNTMTDRSFYYVVERRPAHDELLAAYDTYDEAFMNACRFINVYDDGNIAVVYANDLESIAPA